MIFNQSACHLGGLANGCALNLTKELEGNNKIVLLVFFTSSHVC